MDVRHYLQAPSAFDDLSNVQFDKGEPANACLSECLMPVKAMLDDGDDTDHFPVRRARPPPADDGGLKKAVSYSQDMPRGAVQKPLKWDFQAVQNKWIQMGLDYQIGDESQHPDNTKNA